MTNDTETEIETLTRSRRRLLRLLGGTGAVVGASQLGSAQETTTTNGENTSTTTETTRSQNDVTTIVLAGQTEDWLGLAPEPIQGAENPVLTLQEGKQYRLVWINIDGEKHRFVIQNADGEVLASTGAASTPGATRSVTFTASEAMTRYRCDVHPQGTRQEIRLGDGFQQTVEQPGTTTTAGGKTVDVAVGPDGAYLSFVPEEVTISVGDTVRWTAKSPGHNVTARPDVSDKVKLPQDAEPFASYPNGNSYQIIEVGSTFEHTFTVPGEYVYVCAPHAAQGMVGTVMVEE